MADPLSEDLPSSIDELMSTYPIPNDDWLRAIVQAERAARELWAKDEADGKRRATRVTGITLAELGLAPKP